LCNTNSASVEQKCPKVQIKNAMGWNQPDALAMNLLAYNTRFFGAHVKRGKIGDYTTLLVDGRYGNGKSLGKANRVRAEKPMSVEELRSRYLAILMLRDRLRDWLESRHRARFHGGYGWESQRASMRVCSAKSLGPRSKSFRLSSCLNTTRQIRAGRSSTVHGVVYGLPWPSTSNSSSK